MVTARGPHAVELVHVETGNRITRWPVDARDLLAGGEYVLADEARLEVDLPPPALMPAVVAPSGDTADAPPPSDAAPAKASRRRS